MTEDLHEILEAYTDKKSNSLSPLSEILGIAMVCTGILYDKNSITIGGMAFLGGGLISQAIEYYKAYCSAQLDFMRNGRFTRLEEEVKKEKM
jgi:predicted transcriptional regulator